MRRTAVVDGELRIKKIGDGTNAIEVYEGSVQFPESHRPIQGVWTVKVQKPQGVTADAKALESKEDETNAVAPQNFVELFSEINPGVQVGLLESGGAITPYFGEEYPSDSEMAEKIVKIYQNIGLIVFDGYDKRNFRRVDGNIICTNIDLVRRRKTSIIDVRYFPRLEKWKVKSPISVLVIQYLLELDELRDEGIIDEAAVDNYLEALYQTLRFSEDGLEAALNEKFRLLKLKRILLNKVNKICANISSQRLGLGPYIRGVLVSQEALCDQILATNNAAALRDLYAELSRLSQKETADIEQYAAAVCDAALPRAEFTEDSSWVQDILGGNYNDVELWGGRVSFSGGPPIQGMWVVKIPIKAESEPEPISEAKTDHVTAPNDPKRFVRLFSEINPDIKVGLLESGGAVMPYLGNKHPTDIEIAAKIVKIYQNTGRIVADGCNQRNFLKYKREEKEEIVCIDMDLALKKERTRRTSIVSEQQLAEIENANERWQNFFAAYQERMPISVTVIQYLLELNLQRNEQIISQELLEIYLQELGNILQAPLLFPLKIMLSVIGFFINYQQRTREPTTALVTQPNLCMVIAKMISQGLGPDICIVDALADQEELCGRILGMRGEAAKDLYRALNNLSYCKTAQTGQYTDVVGDVEKQKFLSHVEQFFCVSYEKKYRHRAAGNSIRTFCEETTDQCVKLWQDPQQKDEWKQTLKEKLLKKSEQHLHHHNDKRLRAIGDFLLCLLGALIIGPALKKCFTGSYFFSTARTCREECVERDIIIPTLNVGMSH
jgi:hypothetical protein